VCESRGSQKLVPVDPHCNNKCFVRPVISRLLGGYAVRKFLMPQPQRTRPVSKVMQRTIQFGNFPFFQGLVTHLSCEGRAFAARQSMAEVFIGSTADGLAGILLGPSRRRGAALSMRALLQTCYELSRYSCQFGPVTAVRFVPEAIDSSASSSIRNALVVRFESYLAPSRLLFRSEFIRSPSDGQVGLSCVGSDARIARRAR
jgi:hypothetical protein